MRDVDRMLRAPEPARRVVDDGRGRDLDLRGEEVIARTQAAGSEDMPGSERAAPSPDEDKHGRDDRHDDERRDCPGRLKAELIRHPIPSGAV